MKNNKDKALLTLLAKRVKQLRTENKLTQEQAYHDTGIHFGRIEQGKRDASFTTIYKISIYFGITVEEFFSKGF
ncbi:helix-turn-helix domain-containing protein [Aquimarina mytili]|uniref:Helix-turn-helix transcriptional regulator n=1 Tax=Aquimarina mytili TaxID=874423 RepID=A0A937A190_9FLAO|nr:helix-turn-helix transcriptional regulator [Aquimarina mytili]MBL0686151.1 helix-turn-helix transcriptional regulator [Aquimarina mytili]